MTKQLTIPITGMTCANCVASVERNLKKLDGVETAVVNLSSERATFDFDPTLLGLNDVIARVERAGYGVATGEAELVIKRLSDDSDARRLEKALNELEGVLEARVIFATEKARITYVPTIVTQAELRRAVSAAGFDSLELSGDMEDAEAKARSAEIASQRHLLLVGILFTVPLFFFSMARDFDIFPRWSREPWANWLMFVLITPILLYLGWQYFDSSYKALRNRSFNMDSLVATGFSAAYFYLIIYLFSMASDFNLVPMWSHETWATGLMFALATPVQFYVGWQYYVGAYKALRNGSANMDVLVALGSSVAYFYSIFIMLDIMFFDILQEHTHV